VKQAKRTTITFETERLLVISKRRSLTATCGACEEQVKLVTIDEAAKIVGVGSLVVYRWTDVGKLHLIEIGGRKLFICFNSLSALFPD
jgi:excisionase family DNA binding protein